MGSDRVSADGDDRADVLASVAVPARFAMVFERHVVGVHRYLARRVGATDADDLTGETFAVAFRSRARYDPEQAAVRAWLFGIATNLLLHHHRGESRRLAAESRVGRLAEPELAVDRLVERIDDAARLEEALECIEPELRDVLFLVAAADLSYEETAAALGIPVGTVRSRLWRARQLLRAVLGTTAEPRSCTPLDPVAER